MQDNLCYYFCSHFVSHSRKLSRFIEFQCSLIPDGRFGRDTSVEKVLLGHLVGNFVLQLLLELLPFLGSDISLQKEYENKFIR
jgi:hypothetical protein